MKKLSRMSLQMLTLVALVMLMTSCAVTTKMTEGTSDSLQNTTEATLKLSSSTSPGSDDKSAREMKVKAFAEANIQRLQEDISRGGGEHLTSFAHLIGVPEKKRAEFYSMTKGKYQVLFSSNPTSSDQMLARLNAELDANPLWIR